MKKLLTAAMALMLMLFPLAACGEGDDGVIRLNEVTHSVFYAPLYAAINLGYFEQEGITIELTNGGGSDKSMTAVLSGDADIGLMGPETAIYVYLEGRSDYVQIFGQLTKRDGSFLVGRSPETDFDYTGLEGKEIIMGRRGGMPAMTLQYILNQHGYYDGQNITMNYDVQFNLTGPTFANGTGDYVTLFEPTASQLVQEGKGYIVSSIGKASGEIPYTAFMASKSYIQQNGEKLQAFLNCIYKATQYIMTHDNDEVAGVLAPSFAGTSESLLAAAVGNYKDNDTWMTTPSMTEDSFNRLQDVMQNAGELSQRADYDDIVCNEIADKIGK